MTAPQEITTARLLLRSLEQSDIPAMTRLAGAREISSMTLNIPHPYSEEDARSFLSRASDEFRSGLSVSFAICVSPSRELRGGVGLNIVAAHRRAELGYWIGVSVWGKGYATEAAAAVVAFGFETLRLHRIYAHHFAGILRRGESSRKSACGTKAAPGNTSGSGTGSWIWRITVCSKVSSGDVLNSAGFRTRIIDLNYRPQLRARLRWRKPAPPHENSNANSLCRGSSRHTLEGVGSKRSPHPRISSDCSD